VCVCVCSQLVDLATRKSYATKDAGVCVCVCVCVCLRVYVCVCDIDAE